MPKPVAHPKLRLIKPPAFTFADGQHDFALSQPADSLELEADRTAQTALGMPESRFSFQDVPMLEREPPAEPSAEAEDEEEKRKRRRREHIKVMKPGDDEVGTILRKPSSAHTAAKPMGLAVGHPGLFLDQRTRTEMELRFRHDFSSVRIHADEAAARSARSLGADAYTVGNDIFFAAGQYAPRSGEGRNLLAHELAHVVQGDAGRIPEQSIMRRSAWEEFKILIGAEEGDFTDDELTKYLDWVTANKRIQDKYDSDNKARAIVSRMKAGNKSFSPNPQQKVWLIKEMQSGFTGDDDEQAILYLLDTSNDVELSTMLHSGLDLVDLDSDINGKEADLYHIFLDSRFEGGAEAVLAGKIKQKPWVERMGKMEVEVSDISDIEEVKRIRKDITDQYGIDLNSDIGIEGIKKRYTSVPKTVIAGLKKRPWHLDELHALERALAHYAPILGADRAKSTRAKTPQEVTTASKVEQSIDQDKASGVLDTTTMGEYFGAQKNFSLFKAAEGKSGDFPGDVSKQLEGTITHELAHGLFEYELSHFVSRFKYWINETTPDADKKTRVAKKNVEAPITLYGSTSAGEDISESAMFFFVEPETLKKGRGKPKGTPGNPAPERFAFLDDAVKKWKPKPKPEKSKGKKP